MIRSSDGGERRATAKAYEDLGEAGVGTRGWGLCAAATERAADRFADVASRIAE